MHKLTLFILISLSVLITGCIDDVPSDKTIVQELVNNELLSKNGCIEHKKFERINGAGDKLKYTVSYSIRRVLITTLDACNAKLDVVINKLKMDIDQSTKADYSKWLENRTLYSSKSGYLTEFEESSITKELRVDLLKVTLNKLDIAIFSLSPDGVPTTEKMSFIKTEKGWIALR